MAADLTTFAGVELASGRRPVTLACLDGELTVTRMESCSASEALACLQEYENMLVAMSAPAGRRGQEIYTDFKDSLAQAGFKPFLQRNEPRQWLETDAQDCFLVLGGHKLWPRRTLEGRLQRNAILYEQGLQVSDPVDMFEEITRYKLIQGVRPLEKLPSSKEVDALVAAYLAWLSVHRPGQVIIRGQFVLPAPE
jgi:hypothetical protein